MKGALRKELKSTIKFNRSRFISIIVIIFLGVSFFIGMTNNSVVLRSAMNNYLEENNYWDIKVYSYLGLTNDDIEQIKNKVEDIDEVEAKYYVEALTTIEDADGRKTDYPVYVHSYSDNYRINHLNITAGRAIRDDDECLISTEFADIGKKIGDTIQFTNSDIRNKKYTIVGIVEDPQYISHDKGVSTVQGSMVKYTAYINEADFTTKSDTFYSFDVRVKDKYKRFTPEYDRYIENVKKQIETESDSILAVQLDKFIAEKTEEVEQEEQKYLQMKSEAEAELNKADDEIRNGERQIKGLELLLLPDSKIDMYLNTLRESMATTQKVLQVSQGTYDTLTTITEYLSVYWSQGREDLIDAEINCNFKPEYADDGFALLNPASDYIGRFEEDLSEDQIAECKKRYEEKESLDVYKNMLFSYKDMLLEYIDSYEGLYNQYKDMDCSGMTESKLKDICIERRGDALDRIEEMRQMAQDTLDEVQDFSEGLEGVNTYRDAAVYAQLNLDRANKLANKTQALYDDTQREYETILAEVSLSSGNVNRQIIVIEKEIDKAKEELEKKKKEVAEKLEGPYKQLIQAKKLLKNVKKHPWVINTRNDSYGYGNYTIDINRLENIGKILPMIFFIVASLVTATSITRLVEEERHKIGILKSLGCNKRQIIKKYTHYSFVAALIGVALGTLVGTFFFPTLTSKVYGVLYYIPKISYAVSIKSIIVVLIIALLSTMAVAYLVANRVTSEQPANLLRYKKVKTTPLVNLVGRKGMFSHLSNTRKLVYRNITTAPVRSIMTIAGILGCTTLVIASFSVRQSVQKFTDLQFNKIYHADAEFYYKPEVTQYDIETDYKEITKIDDVKNASIGRRDILRMKEDQSVELYGITPESVEKFEMNNSLISTITKEKTSLKNQSGVIITEKLAKLFNIRKGDMITFIDSSNVEHTAKVSDIVENYLYNYIYMNKNTYEKLYDNELQNNYISVQYKEGVDVELLNTDIFNRDNYSNLVSVNFYLKEQSSILNTLDIIILVVIISAALLAFVVIYNISKISVDEKTVEIATLKVLGYKNKWVGKYLKTEIRILEFVGLLLGLVGGYFLSDAIITACETNYMMFSHSIMFRSYVYGIAITVLFALAMNLMIYSELRRINMSQAIKINEQ